MVQPLMPRRGRRSVLASFLLVLAVCPPLSFAQTPTPPLEEVLQAAEDIINAPPGGEEEGPPESTITLTARVAPQKDSFTVGERFDVFLELVVESSEGGAAVELGPIPSVKTSGNLERVATAGGNRRVPTAEGVTEIHFIRYTFQGTGPGEGTVSPANLEYRFEGEEEYRSLPSPRVTVTIVPAPPEGPPLWQKLLVAVGIPLLGAAAIAVYLLARRRRLRKEGANAEEAVPEWKHALDDARRRRFEGDPRAYLDALFDVLRRGLAARYGLAGNPSAENIRAGMEDGAEDGTAGEARRLLDELERARFAPETPPLEDLDRMAGCIEELLKTHREDPGD